MASTPMLPKGNVGATRRLTSSTTRTRHNRPRLPPPPPCASDGPTSSGACTKSTPSSALAARPPCASSASSHSPLRSSPSWIISASVTGSLAHLPTSGTLWPVPLDRPTHPARRRQPWTRGELSAREGTKESYPCPGGRPSTAAVSGGPGQAHPRPLSAASRMCGAKPEGQTSYPFPGSLTGSTPPGSSQRERVRFDFATASSSEVSWSLSSRVPCTTGPGGVRGDESRAQGEDRKTVSTRPSAPSREALPLETHPRLARR